MQVVLHDGKHSPSFSGLSIIRERYVLINQENLGYSVVLLHNYNDLNTPNKNIVYISVHDSLLFVSPLLIYDELLAAM